MQENNNYTYNVVTLQLINNSLKPDPQGKLFSDTLYVETETCPDTLLSGPQPCAAKSVDLINFHVETHMTRTNPFSAHLCLILYKPRRAT